MSFTFHWPRFSDQFHYDAIQMLNTALNKGSKPPIIADKIEVVELEMGTQPPELEIRDVGDLTVDQFRGIFRLTYAGDAHLVLKTKVQANPLNHKQPDIHLMGGSRGMLAAKHPLVVPMLLRLSHFRLSSYVVLVVSKQKGITLVFKTDPLQNVDINSTFDSIAVIQNFIQREIEGQLRQMFREDLPGIIHRLSQQWVKAKVEAPYLAPRPILPPKTRQSFDAMSAPDVFPHRATASEIGTRKNPLSSSSFNARRPPRAASTSGFSHRVPAPLYTSTPNLPPPEPSSSSHPDLENFDPTYGLRPEGLPTKSVFKGSADLAEEAEEEKGSTSALDSDYEYEEETEEEDEGGSFDFVDWDDQREREREPEYETIPAVGGGTVTRPRVFHSQSAIQTHPFTTDPSGGPRSATHSHMSRSFTSLPPPPLASAPVRSYSLQSNPYFPEFPPPSTANTGVAGPSRLHPPSHLNLSSSAAHIVGVPLRTAPPGPGYTYGHYPSATRRSETPDSLDTDSRSSSGPSTRRSRVNGDIYPSVASSSGIYMRRPLSERRMSVTSEMTEMTSRTTITLHNNDDLDENDLSLHPSRHSHPLNPASISQNSLLSTSPSSNTIHGSNGGGISASGGLGAGERTHKIVLRPSLNSSSIHKLSTLSTSNHTLSPYTRNLSHFTVRSVPPRSASGSSGGLGGVGIGLGGHVHGYGHGQEKAPVKAKRKRTYRLGGGGGGGGRAPPTAEPQTNGHADPQQGLPTRGAGAGGVRRPPRQHHHHNPHLHRPETHSPAPPSEFDESDMDRYFTYDSEPPPPPSNGMQQSPKQALNHQGLTVPPTSTSSSTTTPTTATAVPRRMTSRPRLSAVVVGSSSSSSSNATATGVAVASSLRGSAMQS
ncbi:hypothetical protein CPB84DRAFT_1758864 [Gymnopilus junonius]|uniref:Mitochondrial distribution and morphology protein 34 n=1 Tax=Gymnopilus junonius TaxID=109634 RepID=A0A9P5P3I7_GYMJU|nr:hypothetical protein CPB84DRAFT_1758864 [Gymnopilus junonius]